MATRILRRPVKDRADRTDSTVAGDQLRGAGDIQELPEGVIRLSDPSVRATAGGGPAAVAWPIAHRGRVTWIDAREKRDRGRLLRVAVAAVTRGQLFLEQPTIGGRVLWVSEEAAADVKGRLAAVVADLDKVFFIRGLRPDTDDESSLPQIVGLLRPVWVIIDPWQHYLQVQRVTVAAGPRGGEAPARRHRRLGAGVRGGCHSVARHREEPPRRAHGFGGPRRDGHDRFSRSRQIADNAPPPAVRTVALGSGGHSLDQWPRLLGGQRYRTGPVEDRCTTD